MDACKDMYDGVVTSIRTIRGKTDTLPIIIGLYQVF